MITQYYLMKIYLKNAFCGESSHSTSFIIEPDMFIHVMKYFKRTKYPFNGYDTGIKYQHCVLMLNGSAYSVIGEYIRKYIFG